MDGCSLADAYGTLTDSGQGDRYARTAGDESRRQERKRSRRCRNGDIQVLRPEPDRPFARRTEPVFAMNEATGLREHGPATAAYPYEPFVGESEGDMADFAAIRRNVPSVSELSSNLGSLPAYFGASPNDLPAITDMAKPPSFKKVTEGFTAQAAPIVDTIGDASETSYRLTPDFGAVFANPHVQTQTQTQTGTEKQFAYLTPTAMGSGSGSILPTPNTDIFWKPKTQTGGSTAFFNSLRAPSGQLSAPSPLLDDETKSDAPVRREMLEKMDRIFARLDDMEAAKGENANTEVLMFIATGLGVLFLMDMSCRLALNLRR